VELTRTAVALARPPKGTRATLYLQQVVSETQEEAESLAELRETLAGPDIVDKGNAHTCYDPTAITNPPFNGRIVFPIKRKDGRERFLAMTKQAARTVIDRDFGPSKLPGFGDREICNGTADGKPCIHIANPDHPRIITVVATQIVIDQLTDYLLQFFEGVTRAMANTPSPENNDGSGSNNAEHLVLEIQRLSQFFTCFRRYGKYLDDDEIEESCHEAE
jgi:hypothetical protein